MRLTLIVTLLLLTASAASAQDTPNVSLRAAQGIFIAANVADLASTAHALRTVPGAYESNPLMQGGAKRIALKAASTVGILYLTQRLSVQHPRAAKVLLYTVSGATFAIAAHNARVGR